MGRTFAIVTTAALLMLFTSGAFGQECLFKTEDNDSFAQAMKNFHDVMAQLIHGPAGEGDFSQAGTQAEELRQLRNGIMAAGLSPNLAKRCPDISLKAKELSESVDDFARRLKNETGTELLKTALDRVHSAYRTLNSSLASLDDLVEAFHDVLRPLWHDAYPAKDAAAIKSAIPTLKVRAKLILATAQELDKSKVPGAEALLDSATTLEEAAAADDEMSILEALRLLHDAFEKLAEGHGDR